MACSDLYTAIAKHLASSAAAGSANTASLTLTVQSPGTAGAQAALVQTVSGKFTKDAAGDLVAARLGGVSNTGAETAAGVTTLTKFWTVTLKPNGTLIVQEGTGLPSVLNPVLTCTNGNCGLASDFLVGTFTVPPGLQLPGHPAPPPQTGVLVLSVLLGSTTPIQ